jgi:hypothetical protein
MFNDKQTRLVRMRMISHEVIQDILKVAALAEQA